MGTFLGYILPGVFFVLFALHWIIGSFSRYYKALIRYSRQRSDDSDVYIGYKCTPTFPFICCPKYPMEGLLKLLVGGLGIAGEIVTGIKDSSTLNPVNGQQAIVYFFIALSGLVDALMVNGHCIPRDTDYASLLLAAVMTALMFAQQTTGGSSLDVQLHTILLYAIVTLAIALILEMKYRNNPLCSILRGLATLIAGTWLIEIAFVLYNPLPNPRVWDRESREQILLLTAVFGGHVAANSLFVVFVGLIMYVKYRRGLRNCHFSYKELNDSMINMKNLGENRKVNVCLKCKQKLNIVEDS